MSFDHVNRVFTLALILSTIAFSLRVLGQALQRWFPVSFLPPFEEWQGSSLPYPLLLFLQMVILVIMGLVISRMQEGREVIGDRFVPVVTVFGAAYFATMAARLLLGLTLLSHIEWFTAWISTSLHLVLAADVILLGVYQLRLSKPKPSPTH